MTLQDAFKYWSPRALILATPATQADINKPRFLLVCCAFMMFFSLVLGGGTRGGFLSDAVLQLFAIPVLLVSLAELLELSRANPAYWRRAYLLLVACVAIVAVPLIQLIPLPPWIWTRLAGRDEISAVYDLLGRGRPWFSMSVSPNATWLSLLSLLPPIAVFLTATQLTFYERRLLTLGILGFGAVSVVLGLTQLAQGPMSSLRFFSFTNTGDAVGFFANRNHFAAFLYCLLLFAAAWGIDVAYRIGSWGALKNFVLSAGAPFLAIVVVFICLLIGEAFVRSRAGLILTMLALAGTFPLAFADRRQPSASVESGKFAFAATLFLIIVIIQFALYRVMSRYAVDALQDARFVLARNTFEAAKSFLPLGSGVGSFVQVYGMFEKSANVFVNTFANHAHDDFLELFLETGLIGAAFVVAFLLWLGFSAARFWWQPPKHAGPLDSLLARAASIVIVLLLVHSVVDYPLRTDAIMAIFAFSCALLIEPMTPAQADVSYDREGHQQKPQCRALEEQGASVVNMPGSSEREQPDALSSSQPAASWGEDIEWPETWRK
jgi:O-antigen ligase